MSERSRLDADVEGASAERTADENAGGELVQEAVPVALIDPAFSSYQAQGLVEGTSSNFALVDPAFSPAYAKQHIEENEDGSKADLEAQVPSQEVESRVSWKTLKKLRLRKAPDLEHVDKAASCCGSGSVQGSTILGVPVTATSVTVTVVVTVLVICVIVLPTCLVGGACGSTSSGGAVSSNSTLIPVSKSFNKTELTANESIGWSLAYSIDGNTLLTGSFFDFTPENPSVFTRSRSGLQQQARLPIRGGLSVALSGDGNIAVIGDIGVTFFKRDGDIWLQDGPRWFRHTPVPTSSPSDEYESNNAGNDDQIYSVAISGDGSVALSSGYNISVFVRQGRDTLSPVWTLLRSHARLINDLDPSLNPVMVSVALTYDGATGFALDLSLDSTGPQPEYVLYVMDIQDLGLERPSTLKAIAAMPPLQDGILPGPGSLTGRYFGISADGRTLAYRNSTNETFAISVLIWNEGKWIQQANGLRCEDNSDTDGFEGFAMAISGDGSTIVAEGPTKLIPQTPFEYESGNQSTFEYERSGDYIAPICRFERRITEESSRISWVYLGIIHWSVGFFEDGGVELALNFNGNSVAIGHSGTIIELHRDE